MDIRQLILLQIPEGKAVEFYEVVNEIMYKYSHLQSRDIRSIIWDMMAHGELIRVPDRKLRRP